MVRLAVEAGDVAGARAALASLAGHDRAQAEVAAVGVRAAFPDLDADGALDSGPARLRPAASSLQSASGPLTVGPNPTTGPVAVRVPLAEPGRVAVAVYDNLGRRVAESAQEAGPGVHTVALDLGAVPAGVYLVRVTAETDGGALAVETRRVVVAR